MSRSSANPRPPGLELGLVPPAPVATPPAADTAEAASRMSSSSSFWPMPPTATSDEMEPLGSCTSSALASTSPLGLADLDADQARRDLLVVAGRREARVRDEHVAAGDQVHRALAGDGLMSRTLLLLAGRDMSSVSRAAVTEVSCPNTATV